MSLLFEGEFAKAGKVAADAVLQIVTGVENMTDKIVEGMEWVKKSNGRSGRRNKTPA